MAERTLRRAQVSILTSLLLLSTMAWAFLLWQRSGDGSAMMETGPRLSMGLGLPLFLGVWVLMMVAMMFPTAAPMVLTFARIAQNRRARGSPMCPPGSS